LGEDRLREIALLKVEGYTEVEIAKKLNCGLRTVQRKLERIRYIWAKEMQ
jgi:DNA-directed RNA polymerase specialized sigma24 family protein